MQKNLDAKHFLLNEIGFESKPHSHYYKIEIILSGKSLDKNGYLFDLNEINRIFEELIFYFKDKLLNDLKEFQNLNPSIENFARIFCNAIINQNKNPKIESVTVRVWESDDAWASYQKEV